MGSLSCLLLLLLLEVNILGSKAQDLPDKEVEALRQISSKLGIKQWNASKNSCSQGQGLNITLDDVQMGNVTCDCSFNSSTVCHIVQIWLKNTNLSGELPDEFASLTYLRDLDLTRNFLNGSIPRSWASLPLVKLALLGNFIGGTIPSEIGRITSMEEIILEDNKIGGPLPPEMGNLGRLRRVLFSGNNFTGKLPETFGNLKNLTEFRIDGNSISGKIPKFIGNWTNLDRLDMQGTSMEGPVPSTISLLKNLTELRLSDLNTSNMAFPDLLDLTSMKELVLRNCSITGPIPPLIGQQFQKIKNLDLSFNRLTGTIPESLKSSSKLDYMYLTHNSLTGEVSSWLLDTKEKFDISYNNFTWEAPASCRTNTLNQISSYSSLADKSIDWCFKKDLPCPKEASNYNVFINCGGPELPFEGNQYEADLEEMGPSSFSFSEKWACSTTGDFVGYEEAKFSAATSTVGDIYGTARLAPLSLKYYGRCLRQGSYMVNLHFAEIMLTADQSNNTRGRRIFDVYIQGDIVLKDFNIAEEAGGIAKPIVKQHKVSVTGSTLEIHLYWSGKGTTAVPFRSVYGPLISAISITPNFDTQTGLSAGAIAGIVIASFMLVLLILIVLWRKGYLGGRDLDDQVAADSGEGGGEREKIGRKRSGRRRQGKGGRWRGSLNNNKGELRSSELQTGYFSLRQIKAATNNFDPGNKIGEGGFGPVYKGVLSDGSVIAVKQLSSKSKQGNREFMNEIGMLSALQHPHLVRLFGCCIEGNQLLLIYEFMENNSLARALFGPPDIRLNLDWPTRLQICLGIARGLAFLHEELRLKIIHRDLKATNVLLDKDLTAKISDFGLAKLDEEENTHISTRIAGTLGYMAPEYAMRGYLTDKADVYSFGIVALEIVSGKSITNYIPKEEFLYLRDWAYALQEKGNLLELVDESLGSNYSRKEALKMLNIGLVCTNPSPTLRPAMSAVVRMLESEAPVRAPPVVHHSMTDNMSLGVFRQSSLYPHDSQSSSSTRRLMNALYGCFK